MNSEQLSEMKEQIIKECIYEHNPRLINILDSFLNIYLEKELLFLDLRPQIKLIYDFFQKVVNLYNLKHRYFYKKNFYNNLET